MFCNGLLKCNGLLELNQSALALNKNRVHVVSIKRLTCPIIFSFLLTQLIRIDANVNVLRRNCAIYRYGIHIFTLYSKFIDFIECDFLHVVFPLDTLTFPYSFFVFLNLFFKLQQK